MSAEQLFLGLDVGRTIRCALVRGDGRIVDQRRVIAEVSDPQVFIDQLIAASNEMRSTNTVAAVGVGWAGLVNYETHRLEAMPNLVDVSSFDLRSEMQSALGVPVIFDNDANAGAYAEWLCGAARGYKDVFYVTMGTGIGAGIILGERLQRGCRGFAGEFGHCKIDLDGLECACGSSGCLETIASGPNIVRRVREQLFSDPAFSISKLAADMESTLQCERVIEAAEEEDELALSVLRETGRVLGMALASVINLLNIEIVVLGGGVMSAGALILDPIREETQKRTMSPSFDCCRIVAASLEREAGMIGAALLARDALQNGCPGN
ncbi:MAG TPA: ROK family protein [Blastocatellia bacterium]|jgi:glucokinase